MRYDPATNELISGSDSRLRFPCAVGTRIHMPGLGIWMGSRPDYVKDYYCAHDHEVLLELAFDPNQIQAGNLTDNEPEFATPSAEIISIEHLATEG